MVAIARIVEEICERCGFTSVDVSALEDLEIDGYCLTRDTTGIGAIQPLRMVGRFDVVESGVSLKFPVRGGAVLATLTEADLGARQTDDEAPPSVTTKKTQDVELPLRVRLQHQSIPRDYEVGEQLSPARIGTIGVSEVSAQCPVIVSDDVAAQAAEIMMREAWVSRWSHEFSLDRRWQHLEPSDVVLLPVDDRIYRTRIVNISEVGESLRRFEVVRDDDGAYVSTAVAAPPERPPSVIQALGATEAVFLDLPALSETDDDAGFYVAAMRTGNGQSWPGARIHKSVDGGATFSQVAALAVEATIGEVVSAPSSGEGTTWDDSGAYVIDILSGTLESRTDDALLNEANAAAVGADGRWHIFQFANATLIAPNQYRLTRLLLGRRGTEHLIPTVQVGDTFVLVSGAGIYRVPLQTSEIGASRIYRAVTNGALFSSGTDIEFVGTGEALETFSGVYVQGERDSSDDLTITWIRRDRLGQTLRDGVPTAMSETAQDYEVDIMDGTSVVRTIDALSTTEAAYSAADQTTDFGSPQASVGVNIYQISAVVGRGTPVQATI